MTRVLSPGADRIVRPALLGVLFHDAIDGRPVHGHDLVVEAIDAWRADRPWRLNPSRSGVYGLHALRGVQTLHDRSTAPDDLLESPPPADRLSLRVRDLAGRYVATRLNPNWPSGDILRVPLYSAVTRPAPLGLGSLKVDLRRRTNTVLPACWAWLTLRLGASVLAEGPADEQGRAQLVFPLPKPREGLPHGSPATAEALLDWTVTLHARWHPDRRPNELPDWATLRAQPDMPLLQALGPDVPLAPLSLQAGVPLEAHRPPSSFVFVAD
ncbi:MAG: hypothetical protein A2711_07140 [Burkholderiales bacterium RIFCSPHIGHO2_01_FULL_63_240]|jgi:hypothetical protein|nr:MAG: hypothetical protein A2711_07140 [Burkholderiales bacterium RIFCSPHIGHO2_01_FULL_63_240]